MTFNVILSPLLWALLAMAATTATIVVVWLWLKARRLERHTTGDEAVRAYLDDESLPMVSVLVYTHNDVEWLEQFLPALLEQDYPGYEVIVADDDSSDGTKDYLSEMLTRYTHLRTTFIPEGTRSLSRKKLSLMLGIKAARGEIVINTNAHCRVEAPDWLRLIARNFVPGVDVVLGYAHYRYDDDRKTGRRYRVLDSVMTASQWLGSAIKGRPYRGTGDNLAYRRRLFFDNTGFSRSLDLKWGDDDVFVSEIARGDNTRVELDVASHAEAHYHNVARAHYELKLRRDFTTSQLPTRRPFLAQGLWSCLHYVAWGALAAAAALDWRNAFTVAIVAVLALALWLLTGLAVKRMCATLQAPRLWLMATPLLWWRPVVNFAYRLRGMRIKKSNYTSIVD